MRSPCALCGFSDERGLTETVLAGRERVSLCGTHHLMYSRAGKKVASVGQMKAMLRERRDRRDRRNALSDELVAKLADAFATEKRTGSERRS